MPAALPGHRNPYVALSGNPESRHAAFTDDMISHVPRAQAQATADDGRQDCSNRGGKVRPMCVL
uniref:Uncharacterized protein n=1 Tax=Ralstonia solanacearum TaxID=305 RepID=A0A0S4TNY9_RALSL|nr:protein of unknown function [Ralstonia solanacearum]